MLSVQKGRSEGKGRIQSRLSGQSGIYNNIQYNKENQKARTFQAKRRTFTIFGLKT